jgi:hypothetical protein
MNRDINKETPPPLPPIKPIVPISAGPMKPLYIVLGVFIISLSFPLMIILVVLYSLFIGAGVRQHNQKDCPDCRRDLEIVNEHGERDKAMELYSEHLRWKYNK